MRNLSDGEESELLHANYDAIAEAFHRCACCDEMAFNPQPCTACEYERGWTRVPKQLYCSDCVKPCTDCNELACESHRRAHGECLSCSGPTDAEMKSAGLLG